MAMTTAAEDRAMMREAIAEVLDCGLGRGEAIDEVEMYGYEHRDAVALVDRIIRERAGLPEPVEVQWCTGFFFNPLWGAGVMQFCTV